ncbi:MAG: pantetheine-phosphate adenylyltransferase [Methylococcales bacterium]|jgi:pantetheine-phosphate adenylyltransferase|nr:pantetheine-phosphate adenylyltransferase [Methylococcales bacterium]MBT7443027.1 pantetheine-phosphate adenylyltransferase [Methylococcales bacterium]
MVHAVYPGTFDPVTNGHLDLIQRASTLFDKVTVVIATNPKKQPVFTRDQRISMVQDALQGCDNVAVEGHDGLLVEYARQIDAKVIIRGLRAVSDFEYEFQLAGMNRRLAPEIETLFLTPAEQYSYVSSSLVREIARLGADISECVPNNVATALADKMR